MIALLKAAYERLTGSPVAVLAPGGIHWGTAPADAAMPYIVLTPRATLVPEINTGDDAIEQRGIRIMAFATGMAIAARIIEAAERALINQPLTLDTGNWMAGNKLADDLQEDPDRDEDGSEIWQGILDMEFTVQRQPGA